MKNEKTRVLGWCGVHYPKSFDHIVVVIEKNGTRKSVKVNNPSSDAWVLSDNQIRQEGICQG